MHTHTLLHRYFLVTLLDTVGIATAGSHAHCSKFTILIFYKSLDNSFFLLSRLLIILGVVWVLFSMATSALRAYTLHVLDSSIHIQWLSPYIQIQ